MLKRLLVKLLLICILGPISVVSALEKRVLIYKGSFLLSEEFQRAIYLPVGTTVLIEETNTFTGGKGDEYYYTLTSSGFVGYLQKDYFDSLSVKVTGKGVIVATHPTDDLTLWMGDKEINFSRSSGYLTVQGNINQSRIEVELISKSSGHQTKGVFEKYELDSSNAKFVVPEIQFNTVILTNKSKHNEADKIMLKKHFVILKEYIDKKISCFSEADWLNKSYENCKECDQGQFFADCDDFNLYALSSGKMIDSFRICKKVRYCINHVPTRLDTDTILVYNRPAEREKYFIIKQDTDVSKSIEMKGHYSDGKWLYEAKKVSREKKIAHYNTFNEIHSKIYPRGTPLGPMDEKNKKILNFILVHEALCFDSERELNACPRFPQNTFVKNVLNALGIDGNTIPGLKDTNVPGKNEL